MINILAQSMMTATRTGGTQVYDAPVKPEAKKKRWPNVPKWWLQSSPGNDTDQN
ncbi:MAG: hypothetical protein KUG70_08540 [Rhodobacteraceae bacterium]|nr:hypothetical protein [Paracoccaceae bacterium]